MMGPCAKRRVICVITTDNMDATVTGENWCRNPQDVCPREEGEGYEKCKTICDQVGHAEEVAVMLADSEGINLTGARATIKGHEYACSDCQKLLYSKGVAWIGVQFCYCAIGAGGTPCISRAECDHRRELERD